MCIFNQKIQNKFGPEVSFSSTRTVFEGLSKMSEFNSGVPHGSTLGPLLFSIVTRPLSQFLENPVRLYIDFLFEFLFLTLKALDGFSARRH